MRGTWNRWRWWRRGTLGGAVLVGLLAVPGGSRGAYLYPDAAASSVRLARLAEGGTSVEFDIDLDAPPGAEPSSPTGEQQGVEGLPRASNPQAPVPEPRTLLLLGIGALALEAAGRWKARGATPRIDAAPAAPEAPR